MQSSLLRKVATGILLAAVPKIVDMVFDKMSSKKQSRVQ